MLTLRAREYVTQEDLTKAARKVSDAKKHESKHPYIKSLINITHLYISENGILYEVVHAILLC